MAEAPRRYNMRDRRKKEKGVILQQWEQEYAALRDDKQRRISQNRTRDAIRNAFRDGMFEQWRFTLKCAVSGLRINVPARYADCTHIECFDLEAFLQMKAQKNVLVCPICQKEVKDGLENLRIDRYIQNVLSTLPNAMHVDLRRNGSFAEVHEQHVAPITIDDSEADVQDQNTPVPEIKPEPTDDLITLDDEEEIPEEASTIDVNAITLMPLDIDVKPEINNPEDDEPQSAVGSGEEKISETAKDDATFVFDFNIISSVIRQNFCKVNTGDHSRGTIEKVQNSDVTCTTAIVTDQAPDNTNDLLSEQNNAQSALSSATSGGITALATSAPILGEIPSLKPLKGQIKPILSDGPLTKLCLKRRNRSPNFDGDSGDNEEDDDNVCVKRMRDHLSRTEQRLPRIQRSNSVPAFLKAGQNLHHYGFEESEDESEMDKDTDESETRRNQNAKFWKHESGKMVSTDRKSGNGRVSKHKKQQLQKCDQCSYMTGNSSHLKRHMCLHTGEKPFKCEQCSFAAIQKVNLETHIRVHHA